MEKITIYSLDVISQHSAHHRLAIYAGCGERDEICREKGEAKCNNYKLDYTTLALQQLHKANQLQET